MTTFSSPLRVRLKDGYGADTSASNFNNEDFIGRGKFGYTRQVLPINYTFADFGIAAGTPAVTRTLVLPAGIVLHNVYTDIKTAFAGTSLATPTFNVGLGASNVNLMTNVDASALGRKDFRTNGVSAGVSLLGAVLQTDTTVNFTISVSGTAAQTVGPLSAGVLTLFVEIG